MNFRDSFIFRTFLSAMLLPCIALLGWREGAPKHELSKNDRAVFGKPATTLSIHARDSRQLSRKGGTSSLPPMEFWLGNAFGLKEFVSVGLGAELSHSPVGSDFGGNFGERGPPIA